MIISTFAVGQHVWIADQKINATPPCKECGLSDFRDAVEPLEVTVKAISAKWNGTSFENEYYHVAKLDGNDYQYGMAKDNLFLTKEEAEAYIKKDKETL